MMIPRRKTDIWPGGILFLLMLGCIGCAEDEYSNAVRLLEHDKFDAAITGFTKVIQINPEHAKAIFCRALAYDARGLEQKDDSSKAMSYLSPAITDYANAICLDRQIINVRNSKNEDRIAKYDEAVSLDGSPTAVEIEGKLAAAYVRRGMIYNELAKTYMASGEANQAHGEYDKAVDDFSAAIRLNPNHAEAYCGRGTAFLARSLYDIAIADLTRAIQLSPEYAEALSPRATAYAALGETDRAIEDSQHAIRLDPTVATAYAVLGSAYLTRGDSAKSVSCFEEAIRRSPHLTTSVTPELAKAWFNWGIVLEADGSHEEAEEAFTKAKSLDQKFIQLYEDRKKKAEQTEAGSSASPDKTLSVADLKAAAEGHVAQGISCLEKLDNDKALNEFTEAIRLDGRHANAYYYRGLAFLEKGFPDTAIEDFKQAINLNRDHAEAYYQRCRAYTTLRDYHRALQDGTQAIRLKPDYVLAYGERGRAYLGQKDFDRAIADLNEAIRLAPGSLPQFRSTLVDAYQQRGLAYQKAGRQSEATTDFERAEELGTNPQ